MPRLKAATRSVARGGTEPGREVPPAAVLADDLAVHRMPGHLVRRLQQVAVRLFAAGTEAGLTPVQFAAMAALRQRPGVDQATLSALIGYDRATIGGVIDRLEVRGLVERRAAPEDRRQKLVSLTAPGRRTHDRALGEVEAMQERLLAPLTAQERREFDRLCRKMLDHHEG
jgi:MarR family transcriptional regulator, temperature-dependent positive regulator of motility